MRIYGPAFSIKILWKCLWIENINHLEVKVIIRECHELKGPESVWRNGDLRLQAQTGAEER